MMCVLKPSSFLLYGKDIFYVQNERQLFLLARMITSSTSTSHPITKDERIHGHVAERWHTTEQHAISAFSGLRKCDQTAVVDYPQQEYISSKTNNYDPPLADGAQHIVLLLKAKEF
eukprot:XP_025005045.1 uncharacterized protein LOC107053147 [Gallus gallus]